MLTNDLYREFFFLDYIPNELDVLPLMTDEFKRELREYDIFTTNQLIGAYAKFNFQFTISNKIFKHSPENFVEFLFLKLKNHGFQIPPFEGKISLFPDSPSKKSNKKTREDLTNIFEYYLS